MGVKLKRKENKKSPKEQRSPEVITNAAPDRPGEELPIPSEEAMRIEAQALAANQDLIKYMREFNHLLSRSVLPENRSIKDKEYEQKAISNLTMAAQSVDRFEPGKGSLALSTFAVRQALLLRDAGNRLAYEIELLKDEVKQLKGKLIEPSEDDKKYILKRAEELGIKIAIEE